MLSWSLLGYILLSFMLSAKQAFGRERWLERDNRPIYLYPRRFGQEQPAVLQKLRDACPGQVCGNLAGQAVAPLLAAQSECSQQDMADAIIDASHQFDTATQTNMIAIAQEYRQAEKNTPPDFTTNPPILRNSVFCQKAPNNSELNGLVQAQDSANDPNIFFDPATGKSVRKGEQPNTFPFRSRNNTNGGVESNSGTSKCEDPMKLPTFDLNSSGAIDAKEPTSTGTAVRTVVTTIACNPTTVTVTVSVTNATATTVTNAIPGNPQQTGTPTPTSSPATDPVNFGSCSTPEIEFGAGFDGRRETSFQPADKVSYSHGSADNINIITQFICDNLVNSCKANKVARDLCTTASTAAASAPPGGAQADEFNKNFGITSDFISVAIIDNQGNIVSNAGGSSISSISITGALSSPATSSSSSTATSFPPSGEVGSCPTPEIIFGAGFDGRKETSFEPGDRKSFNHGSAQSITIITQFICDQLRTSCNANQTAQNLCTQAAAAAANASPPNSGAQADAFNAVFALQTSFVNVQPLDDHGEPVRTTGNGGGNSTSQEVSCVDIDT